MRILSTIILITLLSIGSKAQIYSVRNGIKCIVHEVEAGNTLYGISRTYAVSVDCIKQNNMWAADGLSIGDNLFIPESCVNVKEAKKSPDLEGDVLMHKVQKRETLYSLSKKYGVEINDILDANPTVTDGLNKGAVIRIPVPKNDHLSGANIPARPDSLISHLVGTGETLYSISQMYEVDINELKKVNNGLAEGLKKGQRIRIPKLVEGHVSANSGLGKEEPNQEPHNGLPSVVRAPMNKLKVGLMLPFSINKMDEIERKGTSKDGVYQMTDISYEFYRGVQMALDELTEDGLSIDLHVHDVQKDSSSVRSAMRSGNLADLDLVIGPLHKSSFIQIAKQAERSNVPMISPITSNREILKGNKKASMVNTSDDWLASYMAKYICTMHAGDTVILFKSGVDRDKKLYASFKKSWNEISAELPDSLRSFLVEFALEAYEEDKFIPLLGSGRNNVIAIPSRWKPSVTDMTTKLRSSAMKELEITVYGMENWLRFENIDAHLRNRLNMRVCASQFTDLQHSATKQFMSRFYDRFGTIPSSRGYGLLAYDITRYYLKGLHDYGPQFMDHLDQFEGSGLQTGFDFVRSKNGGWENHFSFVLKYSDFEIEREN